MASQWKPLITAVVLLTFIFLCTNGLEKSPKCDFCKTGKCNSKDECYGCIDGYSGPDCRWRCNLNCYNCSQTDINDCFSCRIGFYKGHYEDSADQPWQNDCNLRCRNGCKECMSYVNCIECKNGFYLNAVNACEKCPLNCKKCLTKEQCLICDERYFWDGLRCQSCKRFCESCKSESECETCSAGFFVVKGQCIRCCANCKSCNLTDKLEPWCIECDDGYYMEDSACRSCGGHCLSCLNDSSCRICNSNYRPHDGICYKCPDPCTVCLLDEYCIDCNEKYFSIQGECVKYPDSCLSCVSDKQCKATLQSLLSMNCSFLSTTVCSNDTFNQDMETYNNHSVDCLQGVVTLMLNNCGNGSLLPCNATQHIPAVPKDVQVHRLTIIIVKVWCTLCSVILIAAAATSICISLPGCKRFLWNVQLIETLKNACMPRFKRAGESTTPPENLLLMTLDTVPNGTTAISSAESNLSLKQTEVNTGGKMSSHSGGNTIDNTDDNNDPTEQMEQGGPDVKA